ncbi:MAG TPA: peptide-methionine (S)-S-oxide reductase MsrA [archaeon]|nr:peptide-methionine (S)-S-oxide reductase MsrA [archaeon]
MADKKTDSKNLKKATFGMGCFWHSEEMFDKIDGVKETKVGFMGGKVDKPTYKMVCGGDTGHAEVVQVTYDQKKLKYENLLEAFWNSHNPTTMNRQGLDIGEQYRSVVFYHDEEQKKTAENVKKKLDDSGKFGNKIVTAIEPATEFYMAEDYHQKYYEKQKGKTFGLF